MRSGRGRAATALAVCLALATGCTADDASMAEAEPPPAAVDEDRGTYLALGDSVAFGFRPATPAEYADPDDFVGYPELVGEELGLEVLNASCPGETSASFLDTAAPNVGCHGPGTDFRAENPTHVPYESAEQSQLDLALDLLAEHDDVELVTLQLGANDSALCHGRTAGCATPADREELTRTVQGNVDAVLRALRVEGGYEGRIVVVTYYALEYPAEPGGLGVDLSWIPADFGAQVADGFAAFREPALAAGGSSVAAGLVIPGDIHPTEEGQRLLADAVLAVVG